MSIEQEFLMELKDLVARWEPRIFHGSQVSDPWLDMTLVSGFLTAITNRERDIIRVIVAAGGKVKGQDLRDRINNGQKLRGVGNSSTGAISRYVKLGVFPKGTKKPFSTTLPKGFSNGDVEEWFMRPDVVDVFKEAFRLRGEL